MTEEWNPVQKRNAGRFDSAGTARSFIRDVASQFPDPELMTEFINAVEVAEATLVFGLIEEKKAGTYHLREHGTLSVEFQLAVERLRAILGECSEI